MKLCDECRFTREPHEHKCYGGDCECPRCHPSKEELDAFRVKQDREEVKPQFTNEQINEVVKWMETWGQLKGTAIVIRFKEDFARQLPPPEQKETQEEQILRNVVTKARELVRAVQNYKVGPNKEPLFHAEAKVFAALFDELDKADSIQRNKQ